jgi:hypothetical protein
MKIRYCKGCGAPIGVRSYLGEKLPLHLPKLKQIADWGSDWCKECFADKVTKEKKI